MMGDEKANEKAIIGLLPFVRRYARALTGSQTRGDNYVRLCLETILAEPERLGGPFLKVQLFKAFHDALRAVEGDVQGFEGETLVTERLSRPGHGLAALPSVERQVLLLTYLEEFSVADTALILGLAEDHARLLLEKARHDVRIVSSVSILIIEDEPMIAMELSRIIRELGHSVCGTASRQSEAIELAARTQPALILADIQLKGKRQRHLRRSGDPEERGRADHLRHRLPGASADRQGPRAGVRDPQALQPGDAEDGHRTGVVGGRGRYQRNVTARRPLWCASGLHDARLNAWR